MSCPTVGYQRSVAAVPPVDIFSLVLSLLGLYGIVFSLRLLLPRNVVPLVSTSLNEAITLLENAEATNTPNVSDYRVDLAMYVMVHNTTA